jgi:hypothetical protein
MGLGGSADRSDGVGLRLRLGARLLRYRYSSNCGIGSMRWTITTEIDYTTGILTNICNRNRWEPLRSWRRRWRRLAGLGEKGGETPKAQIRNALRVEPRQLARDAHVELGRPLGERALAIEPFQPAPAGDNFLGRQQQLAGSRGIGNRLACR